MRKLTPLVSLTLLLAAALATAAETNIPKGDGPNPWTHLNFVNKVEDFQFAIVTDRTGGMRPGVFEKAVQKLNLLQPEFVMCIGDLVEGNSKDEAEYIAQRDEFDAILKPLQAPFFYVPGNHDVTNTPYGAEIWKKRYGRLYYHFMYQDVLFLCMNSDDGGTERISDEQFNDVKKALDEAPKARWTFVFMHKPLWAMEKAQGWDRVEKLLAGRPHTVFTGHRHEYMKYDRNGGDYFVLATTGAGMAHQGPVAGEFDEIVWVTLTKAGPQYANLMLDGIADKNLRTEASAKLAEPLLSGKVITVAPFEADTPEFKVSKFVMKLSNPADLPLTVTGVFDRNVQLQPCFGRYRHVVPPHGENQFEVDLIPAKGLLAADAQPLASHWMFSYDLPGGGKVEVPYTRRLVVDAPFVCPPTREVVHVDGLLGEWQTLPIQCLEPGQVAPDNHEWTDSGDCSFRFGVTHDNANFYVAVHVNDDHVENSAKPKSKKRDMVTLLVDARPEAERKPATGADAKEKPGYLTLAVGPGAEAGKVVVFDKDKLPEGVQVDAVWRPVEESAPYWENDAQYNAEFAIPIAYLDAQQGKPWETVRINIGVTDLDSPTDAGTTLWWRPIWNVNDNGKTGTFKRGK